MSGIECPACHRTASETIETRRGCNKIRRRRICSCGHRFTTVEVLHVPKLTSHVNIPRIKKMRAAGKTYEVIASKLGVSLSTVWKRDNGL
jgi:transcriptional regulator NrdR family protein